MKKGEKQAPRIFHDPRLLLTPDNKAALRTLLTSADYIKLLQVVAGMRPSSNCSLAGSGSRDQFSNERAAARLNEMRGWDLYQMAIFSVLSDKPLPTMLIPKDFPDEGTFQHEITPKLPQ